MMVICAPELANCAKRLNCITVEIIKMYLTNRQIVLTNLIGATIVKVKCLGSCCDLYSVLI